MSPHHTFSRASVLLVLGLLAAPETIAARRAVAAMPPSSSIHRLVVHDASAHAHGRTSRHADTSDTASARPHHHADRQARATRRDDRHSLLRLLARQQNGQQREQAQIDARAAHIYALSQTNDPILDDTRACKRIDAKGESIYENCALAGGENR